MKKMMMRSEALGERVAQMLIRKKDEVTASVTNKMHEKCGDECCEKCSSDEIPVSEGANQDSEYEQVEISGVRISISPSGDVIYVEDMNDRYDENDELEE